MADTTTTGGTVANDQLHNEEGARDRMGAISRSKLYELFRSGELKSVKIGRRRMVPQSEIDRYIANHIG